MAAPVGKEGGVTPTGRGNCCPKPTGAAHAPTQSPNIKKRVDFKAVKPTKNMQVTIMRNAAVIYGRLMEEDKGG